MEEDEPACCICREALELCILRGFFYAEQQSSGLPFWLMGIGYWLSGQRGRNGPLSATHSRIPITAAHNREVLPRRGSSYE
jgi:hypothetical protein